MKRFWIVICLMLFFAVTKVSAHQPRIVSGTYTEIKSPEISQAFYGELNGQPELFGIRSDRPFRLYVGVLVPDIKNVSKDVSAKIFKDDQELYFLNASSSDWHSFYEEYGGDNYFWGPEYKADDSTANKLKGRQMEAGVYLIKLFSPNNTGKYILAVGDKEVFPPKEIIHAVAISPQLKTNFFEESILSIFYGRSALYLFVPVAILIMFLISGVGITVILARQRYKEGMENMEKKMQKNT